MKCCVRINVFHFLTQSNFELAFFFGLDNLPRYWLLVYMQTHTHEPVLFHGCFFYFYCPAVEESSISFPSFSNRTDTVQIEVRECLMTPWDSLSEVLPRRCWCCRLLQRKYLEINICLTHVGGRTGAFARKSCYYKRGKEIPSKRWRIIYSSPYIVFSISPYLFIYDQTTLQVPAVTTPIVNL